MAAGGPNDATKILNATKDESHLLRYSWRELFYNFLVIFFIAISAWSFAVILRAGVDFYSEIFFENIDANHHFTINTGASLLIIIFISGIVRALLIKSKVWQDSIGDGVSKTLSDFHASYDPKNRKNNVCNRYKLPDFLASFRRVIMTILTISPGGSGGIEGPIFPIGESCGAGFSRIFKVNNIDDLRMFQIAGISAAVTTLLNTPFAAALLAVELIYNERIVYRPLLFALISAVVAYTLNNHIISFESLFHIPSHSSVYDIREYIEVVAVAIFCSAPAAYGISIIFHYMNKMMNRIPLFWRTIIGPLFVGLITLLFWSLFSVSPIHILGVGEGTLENIILGTGPQELTVWWFLGLLIIGKILTTGFTLASSGSAGMLIPAMFIGGCMGAMVFHLLEYLSIPVFSSSPILFIVAGIASALVAVMEIPLATIAFIMELMGSEFSPPAILSVVICYWFAKKFRLYAEKSKGCKQ